MGLGKQAKTLSKLNFTKVFEHVGRKRNGLRNQAIVLLSVKAGLRAKEIANLTWAMVLNTDRVIGSHIELTDKASKGRSGRSIPINKELKQTLEVLYQSSKNLEGKTIRQKHIISTERQLQTSPQVIVNMFHRWYAELGLHGCSSHSGRRTFITNAARKISTVGGSLRDVQVLAGHQSLNTTQRYIEQDSQAQSRVVDII